MAASSKSSDPLVIGRYELHEAIASGGMATVHMGRMAGPAGFSRPVAIKRLHAHLAKDPEFVAMFLDEARLAARIQHPNVVGTLDVVAMGGELFLVMEYIQGETLARLWRATCGAGQSIDARITATVMSNVLHGLHAAHEAKNERGENLGIVHRDVSPQNVMVGLDGSARVLDFGVAKAIGRLQTTREGQVKGKLAYMAVEQIDASIPITRKVDVYAAGVICWEMLTGKRLYAGDTDVAVFARVMKGDPPDVSSINPAVSEKVNAIVRRALVRDPNQRYGSTREFALELESALGVAPASEVGEWVRSCAGEVIDERAARIRDMESCSTVDKNLREDWLVRSMLDGPSSSDSDRSQGHAEIECTLLEVSDGTAGTGASISPRSKLPLRLLVAGVVVVLGAVLATVLWFRRADPADPPGAVSSAPLVASHASAAPAHPEPKASVEPPVVASVLLTASASASSPPDVPSTVNRGKPSSAKVAKPRAGATGDSTPSGGDCDPPYSINAKGHKT